MPANFSNRGASGKYSFCAVRISRTWACPDGLLTGTDFRPCTTLRTQSVRCCCLPGLALNPSCVSAPGAFRKITSSPYGSPFAVESALVSMADSDLSCEVTRSLFNTIRQYRESFDVYGTERSFEWEQTIGGGPVVYSGYEDAERIKAPDYAHLLPDEIAPFTTGGVYDDEHEHTSFIQGGGHGGSHPHMVHEFLRAILEDREAVSDAAAAANWTMTGICAHESAMQGGRRIDIPEIS